MAPNPPWSDLPEELLSAIANSFISNNSLDILAFRSVCKSWNSSSHATPSLILSPPLPLVISIPPASLRNRYTCFGNCCFLSVTVIYSFRPPLEHPLSGPNIWICFVRQLNKHKVSFRRPFSKMSYSKPNKLPKSLNLLDFHASELCRFYDISRLYDYNPSVEKIAKASVGPQEAIKVIVLSDMSAALTLSDEGKLGLIRLGVGELESTQQWKIIHHGKKFRFDDIVDFKGIILGVDRRGRVYEIRLDTPFTIDCIAPPIAGGGGRRKRVVESLGELYLVARCNVSEKNAFAFKVYKLLSDVKKKRWGQVTKFGDRTFFFDTRFSFSASTQQLGDGCRKNCIVYNENSFQNYEGGDDDYKIFHEFRNDLHIGVWHLEDAAHISSIGLYPSYSEVLWPPPSWIWRIDK